jgi:hypothetical protein
MPRVIFLGMALCYDPVHELRRGEYDLRKSDANRTDVVTINRDGIWIMGRVLYDGRGGLPVGPVPGQL